MKLSRIKFTFIFSALLWLISANASHAQDLEQKITIHASEVRLGEILKEISKQSHINFSYNPRKFPADKKVSLNYVNQPVKLILEDLLRPLNFTYSVSEKQVILRKKQSDHSDSESGDISEKAKITISGYVRDEKSGEVLIGVSIYDKNRLIGTTSNGFGFYSLTLPPGDCPLVFSLVGYKPGLYHNILYKSGKINMSLSETSLEISEVEIVSGNEIAGIDQAATGEIRLSSSTLKRMAGFAGNLDVIKSLQAIPGINAYGDGSSFYYVRGGNNDQNLMLIDDAPIFNPAHLFGFFSALAPDAIKDVKAYKGDFPAVYGGRLSSVIDIRAKDGNLNHFGFSGNLGIYTSDLTLEGPIIKEKSSFILSARKSNLNWLNGKDINLKSFEIGFYDLNAKLNIKLNDKNRLFLTGFKGNDDFKRTSKATAHTFGITWGNAAATLRWNHLFNNRLFSNTTAVFSEYNYLLYISREQDDYWHSSISNKTLKTDFTWYANPLNTIKTGIELSNYYSNPGNVHFSEAETQQGAPGVTKYNSLGLSLYLSNDQIFKERFTLKYGLRISSWRNLGASTVYIFDANHNVAETINVAKGNYYSPYYNAEPRISISYAAGREATLTAGYSRTVQYLQMLSNSTSPFTSLEVWVPSGPNIRPQKADQFTLGFITKSTKQEINFSFELFYKQLYNQIDYEDHANMLYNPLIEGELRFGRSKSYGAEVLIRKNKGRLTGWVGYSYARIFKTIEEINHGKTFPALYDHPNTLFANFIYSAGKHWDFAANWSYMTGSAFTSPVGFMQYNGYTAPIYGDKNNDRLPDYHRLDVSVTFKFNKPERRFQHSVVLSVYNLYRHNNPFSVNFNKIMNEDGDFVVPSDINGSYEIIPTKISVAGIIPSLNYTFKF